MKVIFIAYGLFALALTGCVATDGNPDNFPYAGSSGAAYDAKANPPQANGGVAYDPMGPMPATPSDVQGSSATGAASPGGILNKPKSNTQP